MKFLFFIIFAYLCGSFPTGLILGKTFYNKDIRQHGSKNMGGTNAGRVLGKIPGLVVSVVDVVKVFIPTLLAKQYLGFDNAAVVGAAAFLGHCYPAFANFKGGKGVSSYFGIIFALNFPVGTAVVLIWKTLKHITNYVSVASIISCYVSTVIFIIGQRLTIIKIKNIYFGTFKTFIVLLLLSVFVTYLHRSNIARLMNGTESKVKKL